MAAPPALTQVAFAGGFDESQETEILDPSGAFAVISNGRQDKRGGLTKRLGFGGLSLTRLDGTSRSSGRRQFMDRQTLAVIDSDATLDTYAPTASARPNIPRGRVPEASVKLREVPTMSAPVDISSPIAGTFEDVVYVNGYIVCSHFVRSGATFYHGTVVIDEATGAVVRGPETIDTATTLANPRLASYGVYVIAFSGEGLAVDEVRAKYLDTTSATTINAGWQSIASFATAWNVGFCCSNMASNDRVAIAYGGNSNGFASVIVKTLNVAGQIETVTINTANVMSVNQGVAMSEGGDTLWVAYFDGSTTAPIKVVGLNPSDIDGTPLASSLTIHTLAAGFTPQNIFVSTRAGSGKCTVYACAVDTTATALCYHLFVQHVQTSAGAAVTDGSMITVGGAYPSGRPVLYNSRIYGSFSTGPTNASSFVSSVSTQECVLCDATFDTTIPYLRPVAAPVQRGLSLLSTYNRGRLSPVATGRYVAPLSLKLTGRSSGAVLAEFNFLDRNRWRPAYLNGSTYLSGGIVAVFDGARAFELGFLSAPATPQTNIASAGGLSLTNGRRYVVTWEQVDADGRRHVSGVSSPCTISGTTTNKINKVRVPPLSITARGDATSLARSGVRAVVWGTLDSASGQPPYYRVGEVENNPASTILTLDDEITDAVLATQELLYSTGNLPGTNSSGQDHRAPCGWNHLVSYNGMLVGAQGPNVYWTAQNIEGEGAWTSPIFATAIDEECTGLVVQDGSVYAFARNSIFVAAGEPPNDNATSGGLSSFRRLAHAGGCVNPSSLVSTPQGIMFESARGIERLSRAGSVEFIGQGIQATLASYPVISSAVYDERHGFVRFSCATSEASGAVTGTGRTLVFDTMINTWQSRDAYPSDEAVQDAGMVYVSGVWRYGWLGTDGEIHYEKLESDATAYLDGTSTWITMSVETAWFKTSGLQGRQFLNRLLVLARKATDFNQAVSLAYNYDTSWKTARTWTHSEIAGLLSDGWPITQLKHDPHDDAECQSVRVRLTDATPTSGTVGSGKAATWLGLTLDITPKPGAFEVPEEAA